MKELMDNAVLVSIVLAPITTGLIQVIKSAVEIDKKYLPLLSVIVSVAIVLLLAVSTGQNLVEYALAGVIGGLGSSGLYDQKDILE